VLRIAEAVLRIADIVLRITEAVLRIQRGQTDPFSPATAGSPALT
jgi:hypothetical protein